MYKYTAIRISVNGKPTYGDLYRMIVSEKELPYNEIVTTSRNESVQILFEME